MAGRQFAEKQFYRVIINAPIEEVWPELNKQTAPRPSAPVAKVAPGFARKGAQAKRAGRKSGYRFCARRRAKLKD